MTRSASCRLEQEDFALDQMTDISTFGIPKENSNLELKEKKKKI